MKHFYIRTLCLLAIVVTKASAYNAKIDGIYFNLDSKNNTATVTHNGYKYRSYSGDIIIPSSITSEGTNYDVTSIGEKAFSECSGLTSVTIPESVTSIGNDAFAGCI